ncbi:MAG: winged helix-turn-helix domain-containing protein [Bryobacteraceae bacterium]|nr:winged helix-turn-helix domain-containing protein [Bryobacteraceae bacterium]
MIKNNPTNVVAAFEILLEEIETEIDFTNRVGSRAFEARDYDRAREALELAAQLTAYRDKLAAFRREWDRLVPVADEETEDTETTESRRNLGRLRRGLRTPEDAYYRPILRVLERRGGSGQVGDVLEEVREEMKGILRDVDFEPLASDPHNPRWRNAAQWARHSMVNEGLLKTGSPRGVWEITEKGREYLKETA